MFGLDPEKINPPTEFRIPPDLKRKGSHTTIKVLTGAPPLMTKKYDVIVDVPITETDKKYGVYGKPMEVPYVGHYRSFSPKLYTRKKAPPIDETVVNIPVFVHLKISPWEPVKRGETPNAVRNLRKSVYGQRKASEESNMLELKS